ncbi:MAG: hypothetical protein HYT98_02385 [Candidatus Sungbacteria bacterium]|nr:hypothetical protein [Candidatus Sungbacteria bacterium]
MNTVTIPKKEYYTLVSRQEKMEEELDILKTMVRAEIDEGYIRPTILRRWERISRDLDRGKGRVFNFHDV